MAIKDTSKTLEKVDAEKVAQALGACRKNISELTREECESEKYAPLGLLLISPQIVIPGRDISDIILYRSPMHAVGYRILDQNEELEFRQKYADSYSIVVRYYGKK